MDRLTAYLLAKRHLRQPEGRHDARRAEVVMEAFARRAEHDAELWAVMGLLSAVDSEYAAHNPKARGVVASEQAALEGVAPELCAALRHQAEGPRARRIQAALKLTWALLERLPTEGLASRRAELQVRLLRELELARGFGDGEADRLDDAIETLGGSLSAWVEGAIAALITLEEERP